MSDGLKAALSEGVKYDQGKPALSLLPSAPLVEIAKVLEFGAKKYARQNWRKGMQWSRIYDATMRHLLKWNEGETIDPETNCSHLSHAATNLLFLLEYSETKKELDDRFKKE